MDKEIWKDIEGYEGLYQVSNLGRVRSFKNSIGKRIDTPKLLKPIPTKHGYLKVRLSVHSKEKMFFIHRLVAKAFIDNPQQKPQTNHINGIKNDNRAKNLEWVTRSENIQHAIRTGLKTSARGQDAFPAALNNKQVHDIRLRYSDETIPCSIYELSKEYNISVQAMYKIVNNKTYIDKNYIPPKSLYKRNMIHPPLKLSDELAKNIRQEYIFGSKDFGSYALAKKYGVSSATITSIINNKTYYDPNYIPLRHKLTPEQIKQIRNEYTPHDKKFNTTALAKKYGVSQEVIRCVVTNKTHYDHNYIPVSRRLTPEQMKKIYKEYIPYSKNNNIYTLAQKYGVSRTTIHRIVNDETYKDTD